MGTLATIANIVPPPRPRFVIVMSLDRLLMRSAGGDHSAFTRLYDESIGSVLGLARAVVRDRARAEEIAHDVMLEVWAKADQFDPARGTAKAWIATITRRRAIDVVRSEQASRNRQEKVGLASVLPNDGDPVADAVADRADQERVRSALDGLTELQRQAIEMAYFEDMTYREVAEQLELPLGTVKTRMRDGLMRLAGIMETGR